MNLLEKYQSVIIIIAIISALVLGQISIISSVSNHLIIPFLFLMLFGIFMAMRTDDFKKSFLNFRFTKISLLINFIWTPILAYILGYLFLYNEPEIWIGFIMLLVTPCTDWYLIFTDIAKGNVPLSLSILPLNLTLQIILLPIYLLLFTGVSSSFDITILIESILFIIILPFILAQIVKYLLKKSKNIKNNAESNIISFFDSSQIVFLSLAIFCMFASQGSYLLKNLWAFLILFVPIILFFIINFILVKIVSKRLNMKYEEYASLSLTTLARNSPISLAIAVTAFPNDPIIALALVIAPLIELPVLAIVAQILLSTRKN
ncbi:sodium bile acid symporter family protein [Methanobrevibacter cuticularis]|uniref:Sodium bile acid symporter family protein n=1 Tax=Methanobrevibacter cuticularis TaxID=47311 RepID=A0A166EB58_9EURY|nr:bile acid:sodium symporter [Methanobrevibacter cuticularis]KZX16466.1 sodium bile acid symporter family protein [Methanobrevibacter cuticularis]